MAKTIADAVRDMDDRQLAKLLYTAGSAPSGPGGNGPWENVPACLQWLHRPAAHLPSLFRDERKGT